MMPIQLTFLGGTNTVTGSKFLITVNSKNILIDCGLFQGYKELRLRNWVKFPVNPETIDAVLLTHAHIDHSGYLPLLIKNGFKGNVYCTHGTKDLCSILLPDSGHIQEEDAKRANRYGYSKHKPALPLYTKNEGLRALAHFIALDYNKKFKLFDAIHFEFLPAGHIIGSSIIQLEAQGKIFIFTGDLGRPHDPLMKPPAQITVADYLIIESTYGDRLHEKTEPLDQIAEAIQKTIARGGSVIIPAFAVGRTQDMLYYIYMLKKQGRIPDVPVFLDSPMAQDVSDLLIHYSGEHRFSKDLSSQICKIAKYINTAEESKSIDQSHVPVIIISASGMLDGGRVLHHLKTFLPNHRNTILLTGFQSGGTRGDRLLRKENAIKIFGEMVPVKAEVIQINNLSAHVDYQEMITWLRNFKHPPRKIFLTHGDPESTKSLKIKIEEALGWECNVPQYLQVEKL